MQTKEHKIISIDYTSDGYYYINFERNDLKFRAGEYVNVGIDPDNLRKYSIASGENDELLTLLIKVVPGGLVSEGLTKLKPGDVVYISPAFGDFALKKSKMDKKLVFVATGTGLAPFRSYIKTYPELSYELIYGVRHGEDLSMARDFARDKSVYCVTQSEDFDYKGRVTNYLEGTHVDEDKHVFLCGSYEMIYDVYDVLQEKDFPVRQVKTEVYYI